MPLGLDTEATADVWLESDEERPAEIRPTFLFRYLTVCMVARAQKLREESEKAEAASDYEKSAALLSDAIRVGLVGWRNMEASDPRLLELFGLSAPGPLPFQPDKLDAILTYEERYELAWGYISRVRLSESQKKTSRLQSAGSMASSVGDSAPVAASATDPPKPNPCSLEPALPVAATT